MTVFGWDASHYDGPLSLGILARAKGEGIGFFTHKLAEGLVDTEGTGDDTALAAARSAGIEFVGGYLIPRSNTSATAQVDRWIALADAGEPWWRTFPGWFWQIDLERWPYDNVPASVGIACAQQLRARTGRWTVLYASHGQYGDQLSGWDGPLWNADYTSRAAAGAAAMYPGDGWRPAYGGWTGGWAAYSGREPTFLQYTSSATIAGLTTCDANAYRGGLVQLRTLIEGGTTVLRDDPDGQWLFPRIQAIALREPPINGPEQGQDLPVLKWMADVQANAAKAAAAAGQPAPVAMTDADKQQIIDGVAAQVGARLDAVLARLAAAGHALES